MPREMILQEACPGCFLDSKTDRPLRSMPGSFYGLYCVKDDGSGKGHEYPDTLELNTELIKVAKLRKKAGVKPPTFKAPSPQVVDPDPAQAPQPAEPSVSAAAETEVVSVCEAAEFSITETDASRLGELLGQPISDASTLVGAVYSMKMTAAVESGTEERRIAARITEESEIAQRNDGTLVLQVYFKWSVGKAIAEKAIFNNTDIRQYVQDAIDFHYGSAFFPGGLSDIVPPDQAPYDGFWMAVSVPEVYVGAMLGEAQTWGVTPAQYLQAFIDKCIADEVFP